MLTTCIRQFVCELYESKTNERQKLDLNWNEKICILRKSTRDKNIRQNSSSKHVEGCVVCQFNSLFDTLIQLYTYELIHLYTLYTYTSTYLEFQA